MKLRIICFCALAAGILAFSSCKKTLTEIRTLRDTVINTIMIPPPVVNKDSVLTATTLKLEEFRFMQNNTVYYYKRGATGNTANFDTETIKFNANGTGTYVAGGITYSLTWNWVDAAKTKIQYVVSYNPALTITWEQMSFTNTSVSYTETYNRNGTNTIGYGLRKH